MKTECLVAGGLTVPMAVDDTQWVQKGNFGKETANKKLVAELRKQVQDMRKQLAQWERGGHPGLIDETELHEMINDVERERRDLELERQLMEEERRQFLEEKQAVREMLAKMETEMARERAEHHRQQAEMKRQEEGLRFAKENLARERLVVDGLRHKMRHC